MRSAVENKMGSPRAVASLQACVLPFLRRSLIALAFLFSAHTSFAQYSGNINGPVNVDNGSSISGLAASAVSPTQNGNIRYQWRIVPSSAGGGWLGFEWDTRSRVFAFYGNPTLSPNNDVIIRGDMDIGGSAYGWGNPGNFNLSSVETSKRLIFNITDSGSSLATAPGNDQINFAITEINHANALVSTPDGNNTGLTTTISGSNLVLGGLGNSAESSGSNEELWFQWTQNGWTTKNFIEVESIGANQTATIPLSSLTPGNTLQWIVASTGPTDSPTIAGSTGGLGNFDVIAINKSTVVSYTIPSLPGAPTALSVTPDNAQLSVAFTAGSDGGTAITNYEYRVSSNGGSSWGSWTAFSPVDTTSPVVITGLTNGTPYIVQLRAVNAMGAGTGSTSSSSATPRTTPGAPTGLALAAGNGTLTATFTAPTSNGGSAITNYEYSTNGGGSFTAVSPASTSTSITISGLTNGTAYNVQVRAVNAAGSGTATGSVSGTPRTTPGAPTIGTITPGNGQLSVAFTAGSDGGSAITDYKWSVDGTSYTTHAGTASPIVITGLSNGTAYTVRIRAVNAAGDGAVATAGTTATPRTVPGAPTGLTVTPGSTQLTASFTAPSDNGGSAITNYEYSTNGGSSFTAVSPASTSTSITISGLTNGTAYNVQVRAVNAAGAGTATASVSGTPRTTPGAPTIGTITAGNGQLSVAFTAPASDGGSAITDYKWSVDGTNYTLRAGTASPIVITGLSNGTAYTVRIRAVNAAGDGTVATAGATATPITTPTVTTGSASGVGSTVATLGGDITALGGTASATERGIYYSTTSGFADGAGTKVSATGTFSTGAFTQSVSDLSKNTTYYFKAFAVNSAGTSYGSQGTFTTVNVPDGRNAISNTVPTTGFLGDAPDLYIRAWQSWSSVNRGYATVFGRFDNSNLTNGTTEGPGRDPGSADADFYATAPRFTQTGTFYWAMRVSYGSGNDFYFDRSMADWSPLATTLPSTATLSITVSALNNPTGQTATVASGAQVNLGWTRSTSGGDKDTVIFRSTSSTAPTLNGGTGYSANTDYTTLGGSGATYRCIYNGSGTSHSDTGLSAGTQYYYYFFAVNNNYYSSGVSANATPSGNYTYNITTGTTTESANLGGSGTLTKTGAGELLLTGNNTYTGTTTINGGILRVNADSGLGAVPASATANSITIGTATLALDGAFTLNANRGITLTGNATIDDYGNNDTYNGIIATGSGATTSLTKIGGGILTLGGDNTYTGGTAVNNGAVQLTHANALGATGTGNGTTVAAGNALRLSGGIAVGNEPLTISGGGIQSSGVDTGALRSLSGANSWAGAITLGAGARINSDTSANTLTLSGGITGGANVLYVGGAGNTTVSGAITGAGASQDSVVTSIYKDGDGTLTLSGANTYTGITRINAGILLVSGSGTLGSGSVVRIASGASLTVNANVAVAGVREIGNGNGGTVTIGNGNTLTVNGANQGTFFQSSINGTGGNLTFAGTGDTILSLYNAQGYSGTTTVSSGILTSSGAMSTATVNINGGTFRLTDGGTASSADINLASGGTFDVAGTTSGTSLGASKVLTASATGANTTATLTVATGKDYSLGTGSLAFSAYGGGGTAPLTVSGTGGNLNLNSRAITVTTSTQLAAGTYKLIAKSGTANVTGTPGTLTLSGSGVAGSGSLAVTSGELILTVTAPTLTATTLGTALSSTYGTASSGTSFVAAGTGLSGNITVTAQTGFEVSTSQNSGYGSSVSVASGTTVWVRVAATRSAGAFNSTTVAVLSGGGAASNANVSSSGSSNSVAQLALTGTFTASNKEYDGNNSATVATRAVTGKVGSDDVNHTGGTATFADANAGNGKTVTLASATLTGAAASNYTLSSVSTTTANITQKALTGTFTANNKVYDRTTAATVATRAVTGKVGSDDVNHTGGTATFADANVGDGKTVTLASATLTGAGASNYTLSSVSTTTANITAKGLTVSGLTGANKVYDRTTAATATGTAALSGVESGDTVTLTGTPTFTFASANVGTGISISTTGYTLGGAQASNYSLTQPTLSANITAKGLTISGASATNRAYNATTTVAVSGGSLVGVESGDTVSLSSASATGSVATAAVGDGKAVTVTGYSISGASAGNYSLTQPTGLTVNITQKALTISGAGATSRAYNGTTTVAVSGGSLVGVEAGDTVTLGGSPTGTVASANVGTGKAVTVSGYTISGADSGNYSISQPTGLTADITAKALSITAPTIASKPYDGTTTAGAVTVGTLSGFVGSETVTATATAANYSSANVGTYSGVVVTYTLANGTNGGLASNYSLAAGSATGVITAVSLASHQITLAPGAGNAYTASGPEGSSFTVNYAGRTANGITNTATYGTNAPSGAGYYTVTAEATGNYSGTNSLNYFIQGPVPVSDAVSRPTATMNIPLATLLQNDKRIDSSGNVQTNNLSITAVAQGTGSPTVTLTNPFVYFVPGGGGPNSQTFTYILNDSVANQTATGTATVTAMIWDNTFEVEGTKGTAVHADGITEVTLTFSGTPNVTYWIQYKGELNHEWKDAGGWYSENGTFEVFIQEEGNHAADWNGSMFFQGKR